MTFKRPVRIKFAFHILLAASLLCFRAPGQNRDPLKTEIITSDLKNFWLAFEAAKPDFGVAAFKSYIESGSKGLSGFVPGRIKSSENLAKVVKAHQRYYASLQSSLDQIPGMDNRIRMSLEKLKDLYPKAIFPPVYFVVGALNSGGTSSHDGLIIGAEMYGLTPETPTEELNGWLKTVIKPVEDVPHIVAHELIHFQQKYDGSTLLSGCIKEGAADFVAELISGKHINQHVHDFANPREKELWLEFKERMHKKDFSGWLYSSVEGRPNDLGYWMGYKITKAYFDQVPDKSKAISDIMNIRDFEAFLEKSGYGKQFNESTEK